jgi:hypothetical protein
MDRRLAWAGAAFALVAGALLYTRFSLDDNFRRDEAIYAYAGQQLIRGVPMYVSIFDPKTPLAGMIAGLGAWWAKLFGGDDLHAMRIVFCAFAVAAVVGIYALGLQLWRSTLAAIAGAVAFIAFRGFAIDALGGPDAKTPGIAFGILAMLLLLRRRWFWGAFAGSLAFLVWQPLITYVLVAGLGALLLAERDTRGRAFVRVMAGAALPVAAIAVYYAIEGALPQLVEAAVRFPLTGVERGPETLGQRLSAIWEVSKLGYEAGHWVLWGGLVAAIVVLPLRVRRERRGVLGNPYAVIVIGSLLPLVAFTLRDFQGYPDLYPFLPYAAVGVGGAVAEISRLHGSVRRVVTAVAAAAVAAGLVATWIWYSQPRDRDTALVAQRADAAMLQRVAGPRGTVWALGDPTSLVLTHRRNPSRFIYLGSGVAHWMISHDAGSVAGWQARIRAADPAVVVLGGWDGPIASEMAAWLGQHRDPAAIGKWLVFLKPAVRQAAARRGIFLGAPLLSSWPKPTL